MIVRESEANDNRRHNHSSIYSKSAIMSNFTRTITLALATTVLFACSKPEDPKEVSVQFIEHLNARHFNEAAALATPGSKAAVEALKTEAPAAAPAAQRCARSPGMRRTCTTGGSRPWRM